jgi:hypothetical protein
MLLTLWKYVMLNLTEIELKAGAFLPESAPCTRRPLALLICDLFSFIFDPFYCVDASFLYLFASTYSHLFFKSTNEAHIFSTRVAALSTSDLVDNAPRHFFYLIASTWGRGGAGCTPPHKMSGFWHDFKGLVENYSSKG